MDTVRKHVKGAALRALSTLLYAKLKQPKQINVCEHSAFIVRFDTLGLKSDSEIST